MYLAKSGLKVLMSPFLSGEVATSTVKRPVSSRIFFMMGVVSCQLWLFWPSTMRHLSAGSAAAAGRPAATSTPAAQARVKTLRRNMRISFSRFREEDVGSVDPTYAA